MIKMIKIEFDLPEFEKELNISVTLRKDGEVITTSSSSPKVKTEVSSWKQKPEEEIVTQIPSKKSAGGNMMDISF